jgi:hypothetical protein
MKRLLLLIACLALPVLASAQAAPTDRFAWDQAAASLALAQGYRYDLELDAVLLAAPLVTTCTGAVSPYVCSAPIPAVTPSAHTARVRAVDAPVGGTAIVGLFSAPFSFTMRATPAQVTGLRIVPGV